MKRLAQRLVPRTLRGRLSLVALTTAALIMTLLTFVFNLAITRHLQHQVDAELRNRAEAVATTIDTSGSRARVLETANDHLLDTNVWIYADGRLLERPPRHQSTARCPTRPTIWPTREGRRAPLTRANRPCASARCRCRVTTPPASSRP